MYKKILKAGVVVGTSAAVIVPTVFIVAWGSIKVGRYDANDDGVLKLLTNYREGRTQINALKKQVALFNNAGESVNKGYRVDVLSSFPVSSSLVNTYESQDRNKIANMVIDYPDSMGIVGKYDQQLNLEKTNPKIDLTQTFSSSFLGVNSQLGGMEPGSYTVPITKSTEILAINKLLMGMIIEGVGISSTGTTTKVREYKKVWDDAKANPTPTIPAIEIDSLKKSFPKYKSQPNGIKKVDDSIFNDSAKMLDFIIEAAKVFDLTDSNDSTKSFIFGIDNATNFLYNSMNSKINGVPDKFLFRKDKSNKNGYIEYRFNEPEVKTAFTEIYEKMLKAINTGGLFIGGTVKGIKEYGSSFFGKNRMAANIGSSAGYGYLTANPKHNKTHKDLDSAELDGLKPFHVWNGSSGKGSTLVQGPSLLALHVNESEDNMVATFIKWFITKSATGKSPLAIFTKEAGYIAPTKELFSVPPANLKPGAKIAYAELNAINDGTLNGFDNPVDDSTGNTRIQIQNAIHEQYYQKLIGGNLSSIEDIYEDIRNNFTHKGEFK